MAARDAARLAIRPSSTVRGTWHCNLLPLMWPLPSRSIDGRTALPQGHPRASARPLPDRAPERPLQRGRNPATGAANRNHAWRRRFQRTSRRTTRASKVAQCGSANIQSAGSLITPARPCHHAVQQSKSGSRSMETFTERNRHASASVSSESTHGFAAFSPAHRRTRTARVMANTFHRSPKNLPISASAVTSHCPL